MTSNADNEMRWVNAWSELCKIVGSRYGVAPEPGESDPGEGYMVTKWLVSQPVVRPVIIHSSNSQRSSWMAGEFDLAGWRHWRVAPIGEDWTESDWRRTVRRLLKTFGDSRSDTNPKRKRGRG